MNLKIEHFKYAYNNLKNNLSKMDNQTYFKHLGYLEACLLNFDSLETIKEGDRTIVRTNNKRKILGIFGSGKESYGEAIIRMCDNFFTRTNEQYNKKSILYGVFRGLCLKYSKDEELINTLWNKIENSYYGRAYHNLDHIEDFFNKLLLHKESTFCYEDMLFAMFYHDIVYEVSSTNNEFNSAEIAKLSLQSLNVPKYKVENVIELILATKTHELSKKEHVNLFIDIDLSILGSDIDTYNDYIKKIGGEFLSYYGAYKFKKGRESFLKFMLTKDRIFKTKFFFERYETQARINLSKELMKLI